MKGQNYLQAAQKKAKFKDDVSLHEQCHNLNTQVHPNPNEDVEYATDHALLIARFMNELNTKVGIHGKRFVQQFTVRKGIEKFGEKGRQVAESKLDQLHWRNCFVPLSVKSMSLSEKRKAIKALMLLTKKKTGKVKGRMVYNGKPTR